MPGREEKEAELAAVLCGFLLIVCILVLLVVSVRHLLAASDADLTKRNKKLDQLLNATVGVPAVRLSHEALLWDSYQGRSSEGELRFASGTSSISSSRDSSSGATLIKRQPSYLKHVLQTASAAQVEEARLLLTCHSYDYDRLVQEETTRFQRAVSGLDGLY